MASQTGKWREEQILILCPGSQTTLAQLGCSELTPPTFRIPTRMFRDPDVDADDDGAWRPYATVKRKKASAPGDAPRAEEDEWEYVEDPDSAEGAVYPIQGV
jgi:actin-related protein 9